MFNSPSLNLDQMKKLGEDFPFLLVGIPKYGVFVFIFGYPFGNYSWFCMGCCEF